MYGKPSAPTTGNFACVPPPAPPPKEQLLKGYNQAWSEQLAIIRDQHNRLSSLADDIWGPEVAPAATNALSCPSASCAAGLLDSTRDEVYTALSQLRATVNRFMNL